jgi:hypothetical protein
MDRERSFHTGWVRCGEWPLGCSAAQRHFAGPVSDGVKLAAGDAAWFAAGDAASFDTAHARAANLDPGTANADGNFHHDAGNSEYTDTHCHWDANGDSDADSNAYHYDNADTNTDQIADYDAHTIDHGYAHGECYASMANAHTNRHSGESAAHCNTAGFTVAHALADVAGFTVAHAHVVRVGILILFYDRRPTRSTLLLIFVGRFWLSVVCADSSLCGTMESTSRRMTTPCPKTIHSL